MNTDIAYKLLKYIICWIVIYFIIKYTTCGELSEIDIILLASVITLLLCVLENMYINSTLLSSNECMNVTNTTNTSNTTQVQNKNTSINQIGSNKYNQKIQPKLEHLITVNNSSSNSSDVSSDMSSNSNLSASNNSIGSSSPTIEGSTQESIGLNSTSSSNSSVNTQNQAQLNTNNKKVTFSDVITVIPSNKTNPNPTNPTEFVQATPIFPVPVQPPQTIQDVQSDQSESDQSESDQSASEQSRPVQYQPIQNQPIQNQPIQNQPIQNGIDIKIPSPQPSRNGTNYRQVPMSDGRIIRPDSVVGDYVDVNGADGFNDVPYDSTPPDGIETGMPRFSASGRPLRWYEQALDPRSYAGAENLDQIAVSGGRTRNDILVNEMIYSDFNRLPPSFNDRDFEYGYSFIPPKDWYPLPPYPPVCVSNCARPAQPVYLDTSTANLKEWYETQKFTPPDSINTSFITNELNSKI